MTDEIENEQDISVEPELSTAPDDKLDRETVSKIVARERQKAYEKAKQELMMEQEQQQQMQQQGNQQPNQSFGGMAPEEVQRMIAEHVPQYLHNQAAEFQQKQFAESFVAKMQAAEAQYPGLEAKLNELDFTKPNTLALAKMANSLDGTGAIMNELLENPEKMGNLLMLMNEQPKLAQQKLASLGNSIKTNQEALANSQQAQDPISQIKSSVNAGVDDNNLSVKDLKKLVSGRRR